MTKLVASFTLVFLCWTLEPLLCVLSHCTWNILIYHCVPPWYQTSSWVVLVSGIPLGPDFVVWLFGLHGCSFLLVLPSWHLCVLVSQEIDLGSLWVTCYLFDMVCCSLRAFKLFGKLPHLACRELFQIYTSITDGLGNKLFIMQEKPEDVPLQNLSCLRGVFS